MNNQNSIIIVQDIEQYFVQTEVRHMLAVNYSTIRNNFKDYCDKATDEDEVVIVTRKEEKNIVIMSLEKYNRLQRELENARYIAKIEKGLADMKAGITKEHELIEDYE